MEPGLKPTSIVQHDVAPDDTGAQLQPGEEGKGDKKLAGMLALSRIRAQFGNPQVAQSAPETDTGGQAMDDSMQSAQVQPGIANQSPASTVTGAQANTGASTEPATPAELSAPPGGVAQSPTGAGTGMASSAGAAPALIAPASAGPSVLATASLGGAVGGGPAALIAAGLGAPVAAPPAPSADFLSRVDFVRGVASLAATTQHKRSQLAASLGPVAALASDGGALTIFGLCAAASPAAMAAAGAAAGMIGWIPFVGWGTAAVLLGYGATVSAAFATLASRVMPTHGDVARVRDTVHGLWTAEQGADPTPLLQPLGETLYATGSVLASIGASSAGSQAGKADELARLSAELRTSRDGIRLQIGVQAQVVAAAAGISGLAALAGGSLAQLGGLASVAFASAVPMIALLPFAAPAALGFGAGFAAWSVLEGHGLGAGKTGAMGALDNAGVLAPQLQQVDQAVEQTLAENQQAQAELLAGAAESDEETDSPVAAPTVQQSVGGHDREPSRPDLEESSVDQQIAKQGVQEEPLQPVVKGPLASALTSRTQIQRSFPAKSPGAGEEAGAEGQPATKRPMPALVTALPRQFAVLRAELLPRLRSVAGLPRHRTFVGAVYAELGAMARTVRLVKQAPPSGPGPALARRLRQHHARLAALLRQLEARAQETDGQTEQAEGADGAGADSLSLQLQNRQQELAQMTQTLASILKMMQDSEKSIIHNLK